MFAIPFGFGQIAHALAHGYQEMVSALKARAHGR